MNQPNPYRAPQVASAPQVETPSSAQGIWSDGNLLVVSKGTKLPPVCVLTNQKSQSEVKRTFYWHHPAVFLSLLAGILIFVILALVLRKSQKLALPLSGPSLQKRKKALMFCWLIALSCVAVFVGAIMCIATETFGYGNGWIGGLLMFGAFIGLMITAVIGSRFAAVLTPKKITDDAGWYKGVSFEYLQRFPAIPPYAK